ncbi:ABC transporter ATP-binding protein [Salana multivorans]
MTAKAEESARFSIRSVWYSALVWSTAGGGMQLAVIVILGLGAWRVSAGEFAVSTLVAFLLYAFNIVEPITTLASAFSSVQSGLAAAARIRETEHLDLEDTTARPAAPRVAGAPGSPATDVVADDDVETPVLALRNVTAGYESAVRPALRDVTLAIPRTGHVALVGPSGAGKTTVFSLLLRFIDPTGGRLEVDGVPYDRLSIDEVRSRMSYVEQETPVIPGTVRDNVLFRIDDGATDAEAWEALEAVRLGDKVRSLPEGLDTEVAETSLSGGERQRLAVARALVRRPDVLLLDEATAQLDGTTEAAIQQVIARASATGAVVTIAHRLSTILDADTIVVLDQGAVRDSGLHHELLQRDELYREFIAALRIHTDEIHTDEIHAGEIHADESVLPEEDVTPADRRS